MTGGSVVEWVGKIIDYGGVAVIAAGILISMLNYGIGMLRVGGTGPYTRVRRSVGKSILLGLELLVAADIIRTVAVSPTFASLAQLAIVVAIRTFLSWSITVEVEGRWPWQSRSGQSPAKGASQE